MIWHWNVVIRRSTVSKCKYREVNIEKTRLTGTELNRNKLQSFAEIMRQMGNSRKFFNTPSDWKLFFYKLYELNICLWEDLGALNLGWKLAIFVSFSRLASSLLESMKIVLTFCFSGQKSPSTDRIKLQVKSSFSKISIIYVNDCRYVTPTLE